MGQHAAGPDSGDKKRGDSTFLFPFLVALVALSLRSNQAELPCEKPNQLNRRAFLG